MRFLLFALLACCVGCVHNASAQTQWRQDFGTSSAPSSSENYGSWKDQKDSTARVENGALHLLAGAAKEDNAVLFTPVVPRSAWLEADFEMRIKGASGAGLVFLDNSQTQGTTDYKMFSGWDEPNIAHGFGIGFDTSNPPETNAFNANGNINNEPEREISLHWNSIERLNRLSPTEFRAQSNTDAFVPIRVRLDYVTGGANITVSVNGNPVYDSVFLADVMPSDTRVAFGAKSEKADAFCDIRNFQFSSGPAIPAPAPAVTSITAQREPMTITCPRINAITQFPRSNGRYGRIVAHLTLGDVSPAIDPWDRLGKVYIYDDKGQRFELIRFISSYGRSMNWAIDVSDFRPLLTGKKRIEIECVTYSAGWTVGLSFDFYPGPADRYAYKVENLWNGTVEIGNAEKPVSEFWKPLSVTRPKDADSVAIRIMTTGHGQSNAKSAAEFMPLERTLTVGSTKFPNLLWKTDVYLNPLRPQGGTWKYDRAGWAPGSVVDPWINDVTSLIKPGQTVPVTYEIAPYVNDSRDGGNPPIYQFESTAIFYHKKP